MNIEDCSLETIQKFIERKFGKNLNSSEEDYCVKDFEHIEFNEYSKNLYFGNGCVIRSFAEGDGLHFDRECIKAITLDDNEFNLYLKGSTTDYSDDKIIYEAGK